MTETENLIPEDERTLPYEEEKPEPKKKTRVQPFRGTKVVTISLSNIPKTKPTRAPKTTPKVKSKTQKPFSELIKLAIDQNAKYPKRELYGRKYVSAITISQWILKTTSTSPPVFHRFFRPALDKLVEKGLIHKIKDSYAIKSSEKNRNKNKKNKKKD